MGNVLFKIAKANLAAPFIEGSRGVEEDHELLSQFCVSERWIGDLASGVIKLGSLSTILHGLHVTECGLLNLMRCYDSRDHSRILELFEQAATSSSSFCFSTTVLAEGGQRQPVFCIGESIGTEERYSGSMVGVFLFPRFKIGASESTGSRQ
ncbi:hypothetical protein EQW76_09330 [Rhizobium sp. rho-13.1]|nr:hypothetical protein EQW76_09330 [Rhizobium sp. rho-13.1]TQY15884.1 hypothetical protein EQW74_08920 [Rhizobium sp. rho-1.1]